MDRVLDRGFDKKHREPVVKEGRIHGAWLYGENYEYLLLIELMI